MRSRSSKNKGVRLQNWTRDLLLSLSSKLEPDDIGVAVMGESGEDIKFSPAARREFQGISIECKNVEKLNCWDAYAQAEVNAGDYEPVVVFKKNRKDPKVMVDARFFFKVLCNKEVQD